MVRCLPLECNDQNHNSHLLILLLFRLQPLIYVYLKPHYKQHSSLTVVSKIEVLVYNTNLFF